MYVKDKEYGHSYIFKLRWENDKLKISGGSRKRFIEHFNIKTGDKMMFELSETPASPLLITPYDPECNDTKERVAAEDDDDLFESKICCLLSFLYFRFCD